MLKRFLILITCFPLFISSLSAQIDLPHPAYRRISDICNPTVDDYRLVQNYLRSGQRDPTRGITDSHYVDICRNFKIIGDTPDEIPQFGIVNVNCDTNDMENCVIIYVSFNRKYINGLERLVNHIRESDFKGHILYRIGGWPNIKEGSLVLAHVPYAFKPCFFKEAQGLGYKRVLWLDTSVVPLVSLNKIFKIIEEKSYFAMGNCHMVGPLYINSQSANYFGLTPEQTNSIPSCSSGLCGVDFSKDLGTNIINWWYDAAQDRHAFFNPRPDQSTLSLIFHSLGIHDFISYDSIPHSRSEIKNDSLFLIDKHFVH